MGFDIPHGAGEGVGVFVAGAQDVEGEPLRRLAANPRQFLQFVDQSRHRLGKVGHGRIVIGEGKKCRVAGTTW